MRWALNPGRGAGYHDPHMEEFTMKYVLIVLVSGLIAASTMGCACMKCCKSSDSCKAPAAEAGK